MIRFSLKKFLPALALALLLPVAVVAQPTARQMVRVTDYYLSLPESYDQADTTARWPLMIFLHGAGETGEDLSKLLVHGPPRMANEGHRFPMIVISPQARTYGWEPSEVRDLVTDAKRQYRVDEDRVYLTGLSMGGFGTWAAASEYPDLFAAIIPICGAGTRRPSGDCTACRCGASTAPRTTWCRSPPRKRW